MDNKHLSDDQVARCAESIIIKGSVNFSNEIRNHIEHCMTCSVQVQVKIDQLKVDYKKLIYKNLVGSSLNFGLFGK